MLTFLPRRSLSCGAESLLGDVWSWNIDTWRSRILVIVAEKNVDISTFGCSWSEVIGRCHQEFVIIV
jgi:hypothetical protein